MNTANVENPLNKLRVSEDNSDYGTEQSADNHSVAQLHTEMGSKVKAKDKHRKREKDEEIPGWISCLTLIAHVCTVFYVLLIVYLGLTNEIVFFTWHPILLSIGWMFLMTEGVLIICKDNLLARNINHTLKIRGHWILETVALLLVLSGFFVAFINKNRLEKPHFKSWHAIFGLAGIIAAIPSCLNGTLTLYKKELKNYFDPKLMKFYHIAAGTITILFGGIALLLSVYTKWFERHTQGSNRYFWYGIICVFMATAWTLRKPLTKINKFVKTKIQ